MFLVTYLEGAEEVLANCHHSPCVVEFATVVWRREHSHQLPVRHELVPIFHHLHAKGYLFIAWAQEFLVSIIISSCLGLGLRFSFTNVAVGPPCNCPLA